MHLLKTVNKSSEHPVETLAQTTACILPDPFPEPLPKPWTHAQTLAQTLPQAFAEREISMFESAHHPIQCSKLPPIIALWTRYFWWAPQINE